MSNLERNAELERISEEVRRSIKPGDEIRLLSLEVVTLTEVHDDFGIFYKDDKRYRIGIRNLLPATRRAA